MAKLEYQSDKWDGEGTYHFEFTLPNEHTFSVDVSNNAVVVHGSMYLTPEESLAVNRVVVKIDAPQPPDPASVPAPRHSTSHGAGGGGG